MCALCVAVQRSAVGLLVLVELLLRACSIFICSVLCRYSFIFYPFNQVVWLALWWIFQNPFFSRCCYSRLLLAFYLICRFKKKQKHHLHKGIMLQMDTEVGWVLPLWMCQSLYVYEHKWTWTWTWTCQMQINGMLLLHLPSLVAL